jgi:hypothetical protein
VSEAAPQTLSRPEWIAEIRRLAIAEFGYSEKAAQNTDWESFAESYFDEGGYTPRETLEEDASYG